MPLQMLTPQEFEQLIAIQASDSPLASSPAGPALPLLRQLASLDRQQLANLITEQHCVPGEIVCREGESGEAMYLIWAGRVAVIKGSLDTPIVLGYRGPGDIIGEMALLDDQPRSATNIALEPLHLLKITRERFHQWLSSSPALGMSIMATLSHRLRAADDDIVADTQVGRHLVQQVSELETEKQQLLDLQRVRQETSDLVIHDLRNPLSAIYGALTMLEMVLPEEALVPNRELIDLAVSACERMQRLVDSLLDVAKLETGEMPLRLARSNLRPILENAVNMQSLAARTRKVTLRLEAPETLPPISVDREQLERVLANLFDNALKFSPENGQVVLSVQAQPEQIIIAVTDHGPGIPREDRERIFERFAQIGENQPARRGFGLGLTFCRLAIEAHGGKIWVEPGSNGKGSRFIFSLPL